MILLIQTSSKVPNPFSLVFLIALGVHKDPLERTRVRDASSTSWAVNLSQPTRPLVVQEVSYSSTLSWREVSSHPGVKSHSWLCAGSALSAGRGVPLSPVLSDPPAPSTG